MKGTVAQRLLSSDNESQAQPFSCGSSLFQHPGAAVQIREQGVATDVEAPAPRDFAKGRRQVVAQPMTEGCDPPFSAMDHDRNCATALLAYQTAHAPLQHVLSTRPTAVMPAPWPLRAEGRLVEEEVRMRRDADSVGHIACISHFSRRFRMSQNLSLPDSIARAETPPVRYRR